MLYGILFLLGAIGVIAVVLKKAGKKKDAVLVGSAIFLIIGFMFGGIAELGGMLGGDADFSFTPGGGSNGDGDVSANAQTIESFTVTSHIMGSNAYATYTGILSVYDAEMNPSDPNANAKETMTCSSGTVTNTDKQLQTDTMYRVVADGSSTWYDIDYGVIEFENEDFNSETGQYNFEIADIMTVATIEDLCDDNDSNYFTPTGELVFDSADTWHYDESVGDGSFVFPLEIGCIGGNVYCKDLAIEFIWDATNPPEGNEYSAMTIQLASGTDFGLPSNLLSYWSDEGILAITSINPVQGGQTGDYTVTVTATEANIDTNDDWKYCIDDLGSYRGKDVLLGTKATGQCENVDHSA